MQKDMLQISFKDTYRVHLFFLLGPVAMFFWDGDPKTLDFALSIRSVKQLATREGRHFTIGLFRIFRASRLHGGT
jgi:hypothetical protein